MKRRANKRKVIKGRSRLAAEVAAPAAERRWFVPGKDVLALLESALLDRNFERDLAIVNATIGES